MKTDLQRYYTPILVFLLLACIVRFWLPLLTESFWIDETLTAFVVKYGVGHPSLAAAPGLTGTIYYWLPQTFQAIFGFSELSLRLPSFLATIVSLFLIARLAARFIHPQAGWVAVFLCFIPNEFTRQATDARPYGLGTCVALLGILFLARWLDKADWRDAAAFIVFAALLLRVHLIYWPFYAVFGCYAFARWVRKETPVRGRIILTVFAIVAAALAPMIPATLRLFRDASVHVVTALPTLKIILTGIQIPLIAACAAAAWLLAKVFHWPRERFFASSTTVLLLTWWLWQPVCLLVLSWMTGNSVFLARYFSLALPGMILMCTLAIGNSIPARAWKPAAVASALAILTIGSWKLPLRPSRDSHWREASAAVNDLIGNTGMPVVCPSPFVEAQPPIWTSVYALPGFLYAHLTAYPITGEKILLPASVSPQGAQYATMAIDQRLAASRRFVIYGGVHAVDVWETYFVMHPGLSGWDYHRVGEFGDVWVVVFEPKKS